MGDVVLATIHEQYTAGMLSSAEANKLKAEHIASLTKVRTTRKVAVASGFNPMLRESHEKVLPEGWCYDKAGNAVREDGNTDHVVTLDLAALEAEDKPLQAKTRKPWNPKDRFPADMARVFLIHFACGVPCAVQTIDFVPMASTMQGARKVVDPIARAVAEANTHVFEDQNGMAAVMFREAHDYTQNGKGGAPGPKRVMVTAPDMRGGWYVLGHDDRCALETICTGIAERRSQTKEREHVTFKVRLSGPIILDDPMTRRVPEGVSREDFMAKMALLPVKATRCLTITQEPKPDERCPITGKPIPGTGALKTATVLATDLTINARNGIKIAEGAITALNVTWDHPETGKPCTVTRSDALKALPEEKRQYIDLWAGDERMPIDEFMKLDKEQALKVFRYEAGPPRERRTLMHTNSVRLEFDKNGREVWGKAKDSRKGSTYGRMAQAQGLPSLAGE